MDGDGAFSHEIDYNINFFEMLNLEGHSNCITGLIVTVILLNGKDLHIGGVASGRVCSYSLRSRGVFNESALIPWLCKKIIFFQV